MSWAEFLEWQVFDALEPVGFRRDDFHAAHIAAAAIAPHVKKAPGPADLMPFDEKRFDPPAGDGGLDGWLSAARKAGLSVVQQED